MKKLLAALLLSIPAVVDAADYAVGADLSFLKQAEDAGTVFKYAEDERMTIFGVPVGIASAGRSLVVIAVVRRMALR